MLHFSIQAASLIFICGLKFADTMIVEPRWTGTEVTKAFDRFEEERRKVRCATRLLLEDFYRANFVGLETVLEVGAGKGELLLQWPARFNGNWLQLDRELDLLKYAQGQVLVGSAYDLPVASGSIDVVCGLGSFDTFFDLEIAVAEAARALNPSGWFFHLLDLVANDDAVFYDLKQKGRLVLYDELVSTVIHPGNEEAYCKEIDEHFKRPWEERKGITRWDIAEKYGYSLKPTAYFAERAVAALKQHFGIVESRTLLAHYVGVTQPHHNCGGKVYANIVGDLNPRLAGLEFSGLPNENKIPDGNCLEVSGMQLILARNPVRRS